MNLLERIGLVLAAAKRPSPTEQTSLRTTLPRDMVSSCLLPAGYRDVSVFPILETKALSHGTNGKVRFTCVCFEVKNTGWRVPAEDCEILGTLALPTAAVSVIGYWTADDKELVDIAPRESRRLVAFLLSSERDEALFSSPTTPKWSPSAPLWQLAVPFGIPLRLQLEIKAANTAPARTVWNLVVTGRDSKNIKCS